MRTLSTTIVFGLLPFLLANEINLRLINDCPTTVSPRYNYGNGLSAGLVIGPRSYTNISLSAVEEGTLWAIPGSVNQCPVPSASAPVGVAKVMFGQEKDDGHYFYFTSYGGTDGINVDICPESGSYFCGSTCPQTDGKCPSNCDCRLSCPTCDFVVTLCPKHRQTTVGTKPTGMKMPRVTTASTAASTKATTSTPASTKTSVTTSTVATTTSTDVTTPSIDATTTPTVATTTTDPDLARERPCACTMSNLWLNVIIAMDNSFNMDFDKSRGLRKSVALLEDVFKNVTVGQLPKQQTTVGLISYAKSATILANLTTYDNLTELMGGLNSIKAGADTHVGLGGALLAALRVMSNDRHTSLNRRTVVILTASAYTNGQPDPSHQAKQLKEEGAQIITVAILSKNQEPQDAPQIAKLASPDLDFVVSRDSEELSPHIGDAIRRALCGANCFCRDNWKQFSSDFKTVGTRYGECLRFAPADSSWFVATRVCNATAPGAYLAAEYSSEKHKFINDYARSLWNTHGTPNYFIGLSYQSSLRGYAWQQAQGQPLVQFEPNDYTAWGTGFPNNAGGKNCVKVVQDGPSPIWQNVNCYTETTRYTCQVTACDTNNYCENVN